MEPFEPSLPPPAPFAPPTTPAPPFAPPETSPHAMATVVPVAGPRRRHRALIGGLSALTAAVVAVGAFAILSDKPDELLRDDAVELATDTPNRSEGFSYGAASANALVSASMTFDMSIEVDEGTQTIDARVDRASGRVAMHIDLSQVDQGEADFVVGDSVGVIIDEQSNTVYLTANILGGFLGDDKGWLRLDANEFSDDSTGFDQMFTNPLAITDVLGSLEPVDLGSEDVDGELLRHFQVNVDGETLAEVSGTDANIFGEAFDGERIDVTYDVWVSEDDRVRRISFVVHDPDSQDQASISMNIDTSAEPIDIELPAPADVADLDELFGEMGATIED